MKKRWIGGLVLLMMSLVMWVGSWNVIGLFFVGSFFAVRFLWVGVLVYCLPLLLSAVILLRCKKSNVMADASAAITGCLWGLLLGTALVAGFLKLITPRKAYPYDEPAFGVIFVAAVALGLITFVIDCIRNENRLSFRRFALQCGIAASLTLPAIVPAYRAIYLGERLLRPLVS